MYCQYKIKHIEKCLSSNITFSFGHIPPQKAPGRLLHYVSAPYLRTLPVSPPCAFQHKDFLQAPFFVLFHEVVMLLCGCSPDRSGTPQDTARYAAVAEEYKRIAGSAAQNILFYFLIFT
jgi:hypothetical protein